MILMMMGCDLDEVLGCMDTAACNYDMNATDEDGHVFVDGIVAFL